jgi:hypothetical protein
LDSPSWQCSSSQGALCGAVSGPQIDYWKETLTLFSWFVSKWLVSVSKNNECLKRTNISVYWRHKKCDDGAESYSTIGFPKCFQQWQHRWAKCIAAQGEYFESDPSQKAVNTDMLAII